MNPELKKLKQAIAGIIKPFRLRCDFILRNGERAGKKCLKQARKTEINGIAKVNCNLCWRHRKMLEKEFIAELEAVDS